MKKAATLAAGAAALVVAIVVPVQASPPSAPGKSHGTVLTASATPTKSGTLAKPKAVTVNTLFTSQLPAQGQPQYATKETIVHLPKGLKFNGGTKAFKHCSANTLNASGPNACPSASQVGTGTAQGSALGQTENLTVTAFNGTGSKQLLLFVQGSTPLQISSTIVGTLKTDSGKYGYKLDVLIPPNLQQPLTGVFATLTRFQTKIYAKRNGVGYVQSSKCGSSHKWNWGADLFFTDGTSDKVTTTSSCT